MGRASKNDHSLRSDFTGFAKAALIDCKDTVNKVQC